MELVQKTGPVHGQRYKPRPLAIQGKGGKGWIWEGQKGVHTLPRLYALGHPTSQVRGQGYAAAAKAEGIALPIFNYCSRPPLPAFTSWVLFFMDSSSALYRCTNLSRMLITSSAGR